MNSARYFRTLFLVSFLSILCIYGEETHADGEYLDFTECVYEWDGGLSTCLSDSEFAEQCGKWGVWLPEDPPLFRPFVADPRQITYSVGWRFNDHTLTRNVIDVSYADSLPVYRWFNVWFCGGQLQFDVEGALWAVFDPLHDSSPLMDADYYVGFPVTYAIGDWAFRLRGFHISTHIGDEFLLNHPYFHRKNPSAEFFDFFASYQIIDEMRLYGGIGWIACQDDSCRTGPFYAEAGLELRLPQLGFFSDCNRLYGQPFYGMHFRYRTDLKKHLDSTYVLGYEFGKTSGLQRRMRIFLEYHDGYSLDGQFCKEPTHYFSIRATYGF